MRRGRVAFVIIAIAILAIPATGRVGFAFDSSQCVFDKAESLVRVELELAGMAVATPLTLPADFFFRAIPGVKFGEYIKSSSPIMLMAKWPSLCPVSEKEQKIWWHHKKGDYHLIFLGPAINPHIYRNPMFKGKPFIGTFGGSTREYDLHKFEHFVGDARWDTYLKIDSENEKNSNVYVYCRSQAESSDCEFHTELDDNFSLVVHLKRANIQQWKEIPQKYQIFINKYAR